jgi:exosortase/archaeosortase family protein
VLGSVERGLLAPLREAIAGAAAAVLSLLGASASASGDYVRLPGGTVQVVDSCTGLDVSLLVGAAMLLHPASWRARLAGVLLGFAILMPLNFVRVLTLAWWSGRGSAWFEVGHVYLWPAVVVIASLAILLGWMQRTSASEV